MTRAKKRKAGRPPSDNPREQRVAIRFSDAEYAQLIAIVKRLNEEMADDGVPNDDHYTIAGWIRETVLDEAVGEGTTASTIRGIVRLLRGAGDDLHRIADEHEP